jgi:hypothetical protein
VVLVLGQEVDRPGESATSNLQSSQVILSNSGVIPLDNNSQLVIQKYAIFLNKLAIHFAIAIL